MNLEFTPIDESRIEHLAKLAYALRVTANPTMSSFVQFALNQAGDIVLEQARIQGVKATAKQPPKPVPAAPQVHPTPAEPTHQMRTNRFWPTEQPEETPLPMRGNLPGTNFT